MKTRFYWIIDTESDYVARGPYSSIAEAENYLRQDAADTFLDSDKSLRDGDLNEWAKAMIIVEELRRVQQIPSVKVAVRLKVLSR